MCCGFWKNDGGVGDDFLVVRVPDVNGVAHLAGIIKPACPLVIFEFTVLVWVVRDYARGRIANFIQCQHIGVGVVEHAHGELSRFEVSVCHPHKNGRASWGVGFVSWSPGDRRDSCEDL